MWVKNQDNLGIVDVQALALDPAELMNEENRKKGVRIWGSISDHDYVMGMYDSIEDAQWVLQDFAHFVATSNVTGQTVYTMPSRDQVARERQQVA